MIDANLRNREMVVKEVSQMRKMPAVLAEREKAFFSWLSTQLTNHQLSELYTYLPDINLYGMRRSQFTDSLFELEDSDKIQDFLKLLQEDKRFKFMHIAMIRPMVTLIQKYCEYVEYEKKMAYGKNANSTIQQQESEIDQLLVGDDYALLRDELAKHDITSIEQLKVLNVWVFMNRYGIYGLRKRREIANQIDALLKQPKPMNHTETEEDTKSDPDSVVVVIDPEPVITKEEDPKDIQKSESDNSSRAWSKYEVALLIDAYMKTTKTGDLKTIAEDLSSTLRDLAIRNGKTIDATYRNVNGMIMQLGTVQYCFTNGKSGLSNASVQIREMVKLYRNHPDKYWQILSEAYQLIQHPENEVDQFLAGDEYALLRSELKKHNITKIEQLKALDLWIFMNRQGIYSFSKRREVSDLIKTRMDSMKTEDNPEDQYCLKTKKGNCYYGETPVEVLATYFEHLAQKCPLTMRTLIGKRYNGVGLVVLHPDNPQAGGVRLSSITAYLQNDLTDNTALQYGIWVCRKCGELDLPESLAKSMSQKQDNTSTEASQVRNRISQAVASPATSKPGKALMNEKSERLDDFVKWLTAQKTIADTTVKTYRVTIELLEEYVAKNFFDATLILGNPDQTKRLANILSKNTDFKIMDRNADYKFSNALTRWVDFMSSSIPVEVDQSDEQQKEKPKESQIVEDQLSQSMEEQQTEEAESVAVPNNSAPVLCYEHKQAEQIVLESDLDGITIEELAGRLDTTVAATRKIVNEDYAIVDICGKLIHKSAFVDWDLTADQLEKILDKLMDKNNGYVSKVQLYEYARADMQMFMNDNDMDNDQKIYDMALHLFSKEKYHGVMYTFNNLQHISRSDTGMSSVLGVIKAFAREQGGFFCEDDLVSYLDSVKIKTGNLRTGIMHVYDKPTFLFYAYHVLVLSECLGITDKWLSDVKAALDRLFVDMGDHVVLRDIQPFWYAQLPALPGDRPWTGILLQSVLLHYGKKLGGVKTIYAYQSLSGDYLQSMLVSADSEVQTFNDAVIAVLVDNQIEQREFESEELRQILVERGLIENADLAGKLSKYIESDERFVWSNNGLRVSIKI